MLIKPYNDKDDTFPDITFGLRSFTGSFGNKYPWIVASDNLYAQFSIEAESSEDYAVRVVTSGERFDGNSSGIVLQILTNQQMPFCRKIAKNGSGGVEVHFVGSIECSSGIRSMILALETALRFMERDQ